MPDFTTNEQYDEFMGFVDEARARARLSTVVFAHVEQAQAFVQSCEDNNIDEFENVIVLEP